MWLYTLTVLTTQISSRQTRNLQATNKKNDSHISSPKCRYAYCVLGDCGTITCPLLAGYSNGQRTCQRGGRHHSKIYLGNTLTA